MSTTETFAQWLKLQIEHREWTLGQAEAYTGVPKSSLSLYLRGLSIPNRKTVKKLATAFAISSTDLWRMLPAEPPRHTTEEPQDLLTLNQERLRMPAWLHVWLNELEERGLTAEEMASAFEVALRYVRSRSGGQATGAGHPENDKEDSADSDDASWRGSAGDVEDIEGVSREYWR